jgi:hypothetical protein
MPIEHRLLKGQPEIFIRCPNCGGKPFYSSHRGNRQSLWRKYLPLIESSALFPGFRFVQRPYCRVICWQCALTVGYEKPNGHGEE